MRVEWARLRGDDCLRLTGWSPRALDMLQEMTEADLARRLPVYPTELVESSAFFPAAAGAGGHYEADTSSVCFVPRYPFLAGTSYTVLVHHSLANGHDVTALDREDFDPLTILRPPPPSERLTRVLGIYPTAAAIPRNHLRFYVQFSGPMSEGSVETQVRVVRADTGEPLTAALLPMEHELWDPERRRVTILFDPARIKRGLAPHEQLGYAMREGTRVTLVVEDGFLDADGRPLAAGASRRYDVGPDVRGRVMPEAWDLKIPAAGSCDPLVVRFDRPLDHALLQRCLAVDDTDGRRVDGTQSVPDGEGSWTFAPATPWLPTGGHVVVDSTLEDLAGNSVARVFDRDLGDSRHAPIAARQVSLAFCPGTGRPARSTFGP